MNNNEIFDKPVQYIKMVGPRRALTMENLNITTFGELIYHFPRDYQDRSFFQPVHKYKQNDIATVKGTVTGIQELKPRKNLTIIKAAVHDGEAVFYAVWFNQPYIKKQVHKGVQIIVTGKMDKNFGAMQVQVNDFEIISSGQELINSGRVVPIYPLTEKLGQRSLRQIMYYALEEWRHKISEFLSAAILNKYNLPGLQEALSQIHFPSDMQSANNARRRFIFEELFILQLVLALRRQKNNLQKKQHQYDSNGNLVNEFLSKLSFQLTNAQKRVWQEISADMLYLYPMNRLVQGDVGSGKTILSTLALLKAAESGYQGALMAPTEVLAEQHYLNLLEETEGLNVKTALVSGSMTAKEKMPVLEKIKSGEIQVVVGTHALIQEAVEFANLSLVVIDEQHRFGVRQRASLQYKGFIPDVLVMTATPIPRTLAMTLYGDLDISIIDEMPPGRQPVQTHAVKPSSMDKVYMLLKNEIKAGRQAYVVCTLVEESDKIDVQPAVETAGYLQEKIFINYKVGLLHGRMKQDEKEETMKRFRQKKIDILVSTSVIEVGVDVPNATVMVILDAHRFGLAQLHQLRGRVGRGDKLSYCVLVCEPTSEEAKERLYAMTVISDGFKLAEKDMQIRGPGEFLGTRQSGMPELKIADPVSHVKIMDAARKEAYQLIRDDPALKVSENKLLKAEIHRRINRKGTYIDIS
ncbi:MAG: ATP-dependent DNA helicase RecG [Clostridiales bacterium]|nr:ATP-dependent DNA helicase RecG [Clostridiales bacterium]MCF8022568.1 ATP-dependent DNA helicase RecG [Clostridiales bacterium]